LAVIVHGPGQGERLNERIVVKVERPELSINEVDVGPDFEGPGPHFHKAHVDAFYVLEGRIAFTIGTKNVLAGPGTSVAVPPRIVHAFTNAGPGRACYLNIHAPDQGFIELLRRRIRGEEFDETEHDIWDVDEPSGRSEATLAGPGDGERFENRVRAITIRAAPPELALMELAVEPGWPGVEPHVHEAQVDSFFVLDGRLELTAEGEAVSAAPGTFIAVPPGTTHGLARAKAPARFLNFHAPDDRFADFIRSV